MGPASSIYCNDFARGRHSPWIGNKVAPFVAILTFVGVVSAYDGYLVIRTGNAIVEFELNPVGKYLIQFNHNDASLFLRLKAAGTVLVLSSLVALWRKAPHLAGPVAVILTLFQAGLLVFLELPAT